jgi:hypothetical protein
VRLELHAFLFDSTQTFRLDSSSAILPTLINCVTEHLKATAPPSAGPVQPAPSAHTPPPNAPPPNPEAEAVKNKLLDDAAKQYSDCIDELMRKLVSFSNETADVLAQAIITNCFVSEERYVELGMAIY